MQFRIVYVQLRKEPHRLKSVQILFEFLLVGVQLGMFFDIFLELDGILLSFTAQTRQKFKMNKILQETRTEEEK
jgi:hypothetical protein